jgi:hypothetical protein
VGDRFASAGRPTEIDADDLVQEGEKRHRTQGDAGVIARLSRGRSRSGVFAVIRETL